MKRAWHGGNSLRFFCLLVLLFSPEEEDEVDVGAEWNCGGGGGHRGERSSRLCPAREAIGSLRGEPGKRVLNTWGVQAPAARTRRRRGTVVVVLEVVGNAVDGLVREVIVMDSMESLEERVTEVARAGW